MPGCSCCCRHGAPFRRSLQPMLLLLLRRDAVRRLQQLLLLPLLLGNRKVHIERYSCIHTQPQSIQELHLLLPTH